MVRTPDACAGSVQSVADSFRAVGGDNSQKNVPQPKHEDGKQHKISTVGDRGQCDDSCSHRPRTALKVSVINFVLKLITFATELVKFATNLTSDGRYFDDGRT